MPSKLLELLKNDMYSAVSAVTDAQKRLREKIDEMKEKAGDLEEKEKEELLDFIRAVSVEMRLDTRSLLDD